MRHWLNPDCPWCRQDARRMYGIDLREAAEMTDAHRIDWLAGHWIPVQLAGERAYRIRRLVQPGATVEERGEMFFSAKKAQAFADKLNERDGDV